MRPQRPPSPPAWARASAPRPPAAPARCSATPPGGSTPLRAASLQKIRPSRRSSRLAIGPDTFRRGVGSLASLRESGDAVNIETILRESKVIAVLGAHRDATRHAFKVPQYLYERGYRIIPVNPMQAGERLWGEVVRARLDEIEEPVDVVDVFRRSEAVAEHLDEIRAMKTTPKVVWLQLGVRNEAVASALSAEGITVIQDRCMLAEHRDLNIEEHRP
ncbi:CoA-binding protein [Myxococcota bacterium]|nr:CoA-binding protein [Myxococcota bacterium]